MKTYARIFDGLVLEVQEFPWIEGRFHPDLFWVEVPDGIDVQENWRYVDGQFLEPLPPEIDPEAEAKEKARRERMARLIAAKDDPFVGVPPQIADIIKDILAELTPDA